MSHFLTLTEILAIHQQMIARYGGSSGIRDLGALEAAIYRPQQGYYQDVIAEAAALWESLSQNHPFFDGNNRVAFASMDVFLRMNGVRLQASPSAAEAFIFGLFQANQFAYEFLEPWLRSQCHPSLHQQ